MHNPQYYRAQADMAERLANQINNAEAAASLLRMVLDYRDIAEDLENGAVEIRHAERMPQLRSGHEPQPKGTKPL
jgi:hypothetical protein